MTCRQQVQCSADKKRTCCFLRPFFLCQEYISLLHLFDVLNKVLQAVSAIEISHGEILDENSKNSMSTKQISVGLKSETKNTSIKTSR